MPRRHILLSSCHAFLIAPNVSCSFEPQSHILSQYIDINLLRHSIYTSHCEVFTAQVAGPSHELVLSSVPADGVTPDAVLGVCPVDVQAAPTLSSPVRRQSHYYSTTMGTGARVDWEPLLLDNRLEQYSDMCKCQQHTLNFTSQNAIRTPFRTPCRTPFRRP